MKLESAGGRLFYKIIVNLSVKAPESVFKSGLHVVVTITYKHISDNAPNEILKLSAYGLQIFLVKDQIPRYL